MRTARYWPLANSLITSQSADSGSGYFTLSVNLVWLAFSVRSLLGGTDTTEAFLWCANLPGTLLVSSAFELERPTNIPLRSKTFFSAHSRRRTHCRSLVRVQYDCLDFKAALPSRFDSLRAILQYNMYPTGRTPSTMPLSLFSSHSRSVQRTSRVVGALGIYHREFFEESQKVL